MGNESDPPDEQLATDAAVAAEDAPAVVAESEGEPVDDLQIVAADVSPPAAVVSAPVPPSPARGFKIEVVTPPPIPSAAARRPPSQIVQLGRPKPKSYLN